MDPVIFSPVFVFSFLQNQTRTQKNKHFSSYWRLLDKSMSSLAFSQWRAAFQHRHWPCYSHGWAVRSGLDLLPSQPPLAPPGIRPQPQGMSLILFSVNLLTVCPLPSICTRMNNPVLEDYSYDARRSGRSQPACTVLSTPTGIPELRRASEQARQNKIYNPSLWNLNSTHAKQ